jgi:hypothetical protein
LTVQRSDGAGSWAHGQDGLSSFDNVSLGSGGLDALISFSARARSSSLPRCLPSFSVPPLRTSAGQSGRGHWQVNTAFSTLPTTRCFVTPAQRTVRALLINFGKDGGDGKDYGLLEHQLHLHGRLSVRVRAGGSPFQTPPQRRFYSVLCVMLFP